MYQKSFSKNKWPDSKHNCVPSKEVDVLAKPANRDVQLQAELVYEFVVTGKDMGINLSCGDEFNNVSDLVKRNFYDLIHIKLADVQPEKTNAFKEFTSHVAHLVNKLISFVGLKVGKLSRKLKFA